VNHPPRRSATLLPALLGLVAVGLLSVLVAGPAHATAYRYWSYWQGASGQWEPAQTGPAGYSVVDQDVQGWRFGITAESPTQAPDNAPVFAELCPDLAAAEPADDQLRVAVVVDPGFVADAPKGQTPPADEVSCVTVPRGSTGNQALAAATRVDDDNGLVCALNGYPEGECSAEVPDAQASAAAAAAEDEQPNPAAISAASASGDSAPAEAPAGTGLIVGAAALAAVVGALVVLVRRRRGGGGS
jgi:hypothetical protein